MWVDRGEALNRIDSRGLREGYPSEDDGFQPRKQPDAVVIDAEFTWGQTQGPAGKNTHKMALSVARWPSRNWPERRDRACQVEDSSAPNRGH